MATKAYIMKMYLNKNDKRSWAVAYSGGKDSTAVLGLLVSVMKSLPKDELKRKIYIVMSNTAMENPLVDEHMYEQATLIKKYVKENYLPIKIKVVQREIKESYFVKVLGLGYPLPLNNGGGRWCTGRLKIGPQNEQLKKVNPSYILTGVRLSESESRKKSIEKWQIDEFIGGHALKDTNTFNPIIHWTVEDVWRFLEYEGLEWGSTMSVRTIYKDATGECGFSNPIGVEKKSVEVCGARHGCWTCPVILNDKSTEKMSEKHIWMQPLTYWRELQLKVYGNYKAQYETPYREASKEDKQKQRVNNKKVREQNEFITLRTKAGYNRKGTRMKDGQGTLTLKARMLLLKELLEVEKMVNRLRKQNNLDSNLKLISDDEIKLIKKYWKTDKEENSYLIDNALGLNIKDIEKYL